MNGYLVGMLNILAASQQFVLLPAVFILFLIAPAWIFSQKRNYLSSYEFLMPFVAPLLWVVIVSEFHTSKSFENYIDVVLFIPLLVLAAGYFKAFVLRLWIKNVSMASLIFVVAVLAGTLAIIFLVPPISE